jgi:UDP-N-acetylglucosamine:LPS N-acetylglucosamine transferase
VLLPQAGDQYRNAEILSAAGAALICSSDAPDDIAAAIACVLNTPTLTEQAALIARDNAAMTDITELAHHISGLDR